MKVDSLVQLLSSARFSLGTEKELQSDVASFLERKGIPFDREKALSRTDIVDFMVGNVAVEAKVKGARKRAVLAQCERYCEHENVHALILITNLAMGFPQEINGKPTYFVSLGKAWL